MQLIHSLTDTVILADSDPLTGISAEEAKDLTTQEIIDIGLPTLRKSFAEYLAPKTYSAQMLFCAAVPQCVNLALTDPLEDEPESGETTDAQVEDTATELLSDLLHLCGGKRYEWHHQLLSWLATRTDPQRVLKEMRAPLRQLHHEKLLFLHRLASFFWQKADDACQVSCISISL